MWEGGGLYDDSGQTYRVATSSDMNTLDTVLATDTVSFTIYNQVFEGLYTLNGKDEAIPGIAKGDPKESNNGKTLTIKLRKMQNGQMEIQLQHMILYLLGEKL